MKDERRSAIGSRIREARQMAGLSQGQVAKLLGLHRPSVSEIEAGNRAVTAEELTEIAGILEVSTGWLLGEPDGNHKSSADRVQLAARELAKLKPDDLDRLLSLLDSLKEKG